MRSLPTCNAIIQYEHGDGFRVVLPKMLSTTDIVVVQNQSALAQMAKSGRMDRIEAVTLQTLNKIKEGTYSRLVIDAYLPQANSKAAKALRKLAKDRTIVFTRSMHRPSAVNTALYLLSATKSNYFKVMPFSMFMHNYRRGW